MTVLTLNGTQVFPDGNQQIKLIRENPYFTQSESYTLDVTLPMDILENRDFFQNIHRMEHRKTTGTMSCCLEVNNKPLLTGTAKVTQITEQNVNVQLLGGRSEINILSSENKTYIDEYEWGELQGRLPIRVEHMPAYDETYEYHLNLWNMGYHNFAFASDFYWPEAIQPCLVDVMEAVLRQEGYDVVENETDAEPWNCLYVASAKRTSNPFHALPHWTVREFIDEYSKFFNCTLIVDQNAKTVRIVLNKDFFNSSRHVDLDPIDEYTVELNEGSESSTLSTANLRFDLSESEGHDYDCIPDNVRTSANYKDCPSVEAAQAQCNRDGEEGRNYIYRTPVGLFVSWEHDMSEEDGSTAPRTSFTQIDVFGPLIRDAASDSEITLKICPVAIDCDTFYYKPYMVTPDAEGKYPWRWIALENPTGNEFARVGFSEEDPAAPEEEEYPVQEYIEGEAETEKSEKEDRLQVYFRDDTPMQSVCYGGWDDAPILNAPMPFTDYLYKRMWGTSHRQWSLSLNSSPARHYLGQLHQNNYTFNMKAKYCVKFLADEMPDPTQVFIIRNKLFGCEKIEAQIDDQGLQQLMTGYFYEMIL